MVGASSRMKLLKTSAARFKKLAYRVNVSFGSFDVLGGFKRQRIIGCLGVAVEEICDLVGCNAVFRVRDRR